MLGGFFAFFVLAAGLGIAIWIFSLMSDAITRLPSEHQMMSSGGVFICLVPVVGAFWLIRVVSAITSSYNSYFDDRHLPRRKTGYGFGMGWAGCWILGLLFSVSTPLIFFSFGKDMRTIMMIIPVVQLLGGAAFLSTLVLMILYLVSLSSLKKSISDIELDEFGHSVKVTSRDAESEPV